MLCKYQNPKEADAMTKIQQDLDDTKIILVIFFFHTNYQLSYLAILNITIKKNFNYIILLITLIRNLYQNHLLGFRVLLKNPCFG